FNESKERLRMRKLLALGVVLVALAGSAAAAPNLTSFRGTVVGVHGGTLLVALPSGTVRAIAGHARIGTRISFGGGRLTVLGHAHRALIKGVVVKRRANLTFLSAANHVLLVRTVRTLGSARDTRPAPGSLVQTTVAIDDQGELDEQNEEVLGHQAEAEVQAVVTAVGPGSVTLTVNGQPLVIPLPAG